VTSTDEQVAVVWSTGRGRRLAQFLIHQVGLPELGWRGAVRLTHHCGRCGSTDHGRPILVADGDGHAPYVSVSYSDTLCVVALSAAGPVGVDVEQERAGAFAGFAEVVGQATDGVDAASNVVTWTRKESLLKAAGRGLDVDPRLVQVTSPRQPPALVAWDAPEPPSEAVWISDLDLTTGYAAALTVLAPERPRLTVTKADPEASSG
jgi:4'-phosphopantetheinyl transferase